MTPTTADWAWAAGFLEGEGSFTHDSGPRISANQVHRDPLDRLASILGGNVGGPYDGKGVRQDFHSWALRSRNLIITAFEPLCAWLSPRRVEQYKQSLETYLMADGSYRLARPCGTRTHCPQNHPYAGENLYVQPNGQRVCKTCTATRRRERLGQTARKSYL